MNVPPTEFKLFPLSDWNREQVFYWYKPVDFFSIVRAFEPLEISTGIEQYRVGRDKMAFIGSGKEYDITQSVMAKGYIITFTAAFYEKSISDSVLLNSELFFDAFQSVQITDTLGDEEDFMKLISRTENLVHDVSDLVIHNCIESLLLEGMQHIKFNSCLLDYGAVPIRGMVNAFSILVHKHFKEQTNVQFYAEKLNVTPRKLTEMCLAIWGKTAKSAISDIVLKEALRYIKHTDLSISQIAYEMGFTDESNFRHFVKKCTGNIPMSYRQIYAL
ncbi:helix-turn-helix domain-containing protein [Sphingobacterium faecium]|jgi:AraC family transcriptional activator of pobA|uniref:helix-turn-helix domain-containing protein n=1 Tax=Sphingobacterium faecium TaxID=34087 RepID=UPI003209ECEA